MIRHKKAERDENMEDTRQKLLSAAAAEFATEGFAGANVNRIAKQSGYSIGTVYNYFSSKRELMHAFISETGSMHVEFIEEQVKKESDPSQRLSAFFKAGFSFVENNIIPSQAIFNALNGPDQEFKLRLFEVYQPLFRLIHEDILGAGVAKGDFRPLDLTATTGLLMLFYLGAGSQFGPEGRLWVDYAQVSDFILHALQNPNPRR